MYHDTLPPVDVSAKGGRRMGVQVKPYLPTPAIRDLYSQIHREGGQDKFTQ